jgi:S1-C subfamily serine protease
MIVCPENRRAQLLLLSACLALCACHPKTELKQLNGVMLSAVTEPAVFKVVTLAEYQLRDVRFVRNPDALIPIAASPNCWATIADSPGQYITTSLKSDRILSVRKTFATGSSFAVSPQGVFLTNAHVIAPPDSTKLEELLPAIAESLAPLVSGLHGRNPTQLELLLNPNLRAAGCLAGIPADKDARKAFVNTMAAWMIRQVLSKVRTYAVYVVTRPRQVLLPAVGYGGLFASKYDLFTRGLTKPVPTTSAPPDPNEINVNLETASDNPATYATEMDIMTSGQIFPGEDVAVLRSKKTLELIALPLGDSSGAELPDGSSIVAFGFPGAAEMSGLKQDQAHPKVIAHDGKMVQRVSTDKDWEALYITAAISEGDSGGPIMDRYGRVVALNVYGNQNRAGNNVAVPINLAKKYLTQAKVEPDSGPLTARWLAGQDYYARGEYTKALQEFEIVDGTRPDPESTKSFRDRVKDLFNAKATAGLPPTSRGNDYVAQAIANCKLKLHLK